MKILFFINQLHGGGAEHIASILLNHFCERHDTYVAITNLKTPSFPIDNRVHIIDDRIKSKIKGASRIPRFIKMMLTIKKVSPDLIIPFMTKSCINSLIANLIFRKKIIVYEHNTLNRIQSNRIKKLRKILYPMADKIVFVANEDCKAFNYPPKSLTIYNPSVFSPYNNYNNRKSSIITIAPTNRWYNKGLDLLIYAWSKIASNNCDWNLEILGESNEKDLPNDISIHNNTRITLLGWHTNVAEILRTKSIFILASRYEGCPISLLEAMSQGCACIGTDCEGGMKELITNGVDGLIVKNEDVNDIAAKLQMLIDDENLRRRLSAKAIEKAKQFDKNVFFAKWDKLIEEVAEK